MKELLLSKKTSKVSLGVSILLSSLLQFFDWILGLFLWFGIIFLNLLQFKVVFSINAISTIVRRVWIYQRVIRIRKSKDRQHNGQNKRKGTKGQQRSTKLTYKTKQ